MLHLTLKAAVEQHANPQKAVMSAKFFKTSQGQYGEGDIFIGVNVPTLRRLAKQFVAQATVSDIEILLIDARHEMRLLAVLLLVYQFAQADALQQKTLYDFYVAHSKRINNWDLVDSSASHIVGAYLFDKNRAVLLELASAAQLWQQRIAIIATFYFIKRGQFADTFQIADILLNHPHDLIHKAVGWMLREVGKQDMSALTLFLETRYQTMPRTMLRYAIEKFPESVRQGYLTKTH